MELREYYGIVLKWWWLLILCTLLGGGAAYLVSSQMPRTFQASTLLMIGGSLDTVNPTTGELATSEKLAQTYAELVKTRPVVEATMLALDLPEMPEIAVTLVRNTQLLRITVSGQDARQVAAIANELARQLILQSPSDPQRDEQAYREFVRGQLRELEEEIATLSQAIIDRGAAPTGELDRLQEALNTRRSNYSMLLSYLQSSSVNYVTIFEPAQVPKAPISPKVLQNTVLAAVVGLMLAGGAAFLLEYLDNSVRGPEDIEQLSLPMLGTIGRTGKDYADAEIVLLKHPKSSFAEAYRMLYTNLRYALPASTKGRVFLFTSASAEEGKTTISANVAAVMAMAGQRTVLIDADLRRPRQHKVWGVENEVGLSSLLVGEVEDVAAILLPTAIEGLTILPSGPIPPNAAELLNSARMKELLQSLQEQADVLILDSPPVFAVTDAVVLASMVTASILVVEAGKTPLQACSGAVEALKRAADNFAGVVLNNIEVKQRGYGHYSYYGGYYSYGYGSAYGSTEGEDPKNSNTGWQRVREHVRRWLGRAH
jgi:non-specific protein-tyrosine kinase